MKPIVFIFLLSITQVSFGQSLKKKYLGTYSGGMSAYTMDAGGTVVDVKPSEVSVEITGNEIIRTIGGLSQRGTYSVSSPEKDYYVIEMRFSDSKVIQRLLLYKKPKELIFQGIYPQPDVVLRKTKN